MFAIDKTTKTIYCTRGDKGSINLKIKDYTFGTGDLISFRVYEKNGLNKDPLIDKEITLEEPKEMVIINLTSEETKIGEMLNKEITYWYEIELNNNQTIFGYDSNGAKEFILMPEGKLKTYEPEGE